MILVLDISGHAQNFIYSEKRTTKLRRNLKQNKDEIFTKITWETNRGKIKQTFLVWAKSRNSRNSPLLMWTLVNHLQLPWPQMPYPFVFSPKKYPFVCVCSLSQTLTHSVTHSLTHTHTNREREGCLTEFKRGFKREGEMFSTVRFCAVMLICHWIDYCCLWWYNDTCYLNITYLLD